MTPTRHKAIFHSVRAAFTLSGFLAALALGVPSAVAQRGSLRASGRIVDPGGAGIAGAGIRVSSPTETQQTTTDARGAFSVVLVGGAAGADALDLRVERIGFYTFSGTIPVPTGAGAVTRDVRLNPKAVQLQEVVARAQRPTQRPPEGRTPAGTEDARNAYIYNKYPFAPGDFGQLATLSPGVVPLGGDDGGIPRLSIGGQSPTQTSFALDGASFGASAVPAEALRSTSVATSTYDASRGQFSGGQVAATTRAGTNTFGGSLAARVNPSFLQSSSVATAGPPTGDVFQVSSGIGGALVRDRLFYFAALQASRRTASAPSLESAEPGTLRSLGLNPDSAERFEEITRGFGLVPDPQEATRTRRTDRASGMFRIDMHPSDRAILMVRLDGRYAEVRGIGSSPWALRGSAGSIRNEAGGVLTQLTSYFGERVRNEARVYLSRDVTRLAPDLVWPSVQVQLSNSQADGSASTSVVRLGGGIPTSRSAATAMEVGDEMLVRISGDAHRVKIGMLVGRQRAEIAGSSDAFGTYTYRSLDDYAAGRAASYSRSLGGVRQSALGGYGAAFASHIWKVSPHLWVIDGLRLEHRRYGGEGVNGSPSPGLSAGAPAAEWGVSPRFGFGAESATHKTDLWGGVGTFMGTLPTAALADAFSSSGSAVELRCVGAAVPSQDWKRLVADPAAAPVACAAGASTFSSLARSGTVFGGDVSAPLTRRGSLGVSHELFQNSWGMVTLYSEASRTESSNQPLGSDANLGTVQFSLPAEGGREVYVTPGGIDPETGEVSATTSRRDTAYGQLRRLDSRGRSHATQVTIGAYLLKRATGLVLVDYTFNRVRDETGALTSLPGFAAPLARAVSNVAVDGTSDFERRHVLRVAWTKMLFGVDLHVTSRFMSGMPYTPMVDSDVNGDGMANDAAFLFDPTTVDQDLAGGLRQLRASASGATRACLTGRVNVIANRNVCRTSWSSSVDGQADLAARTKGPLRGLAWSLTATNLLGGADRVLHGREHLRGWGDPSGVDPVLLRVRGFDPATRTYFYSVNPTFGTQRPGRNPYHTPFSVSIQARWAIGSDPVRQPLVALRNNIRSQGRTAAQIRDELDKRVPNVAYQILALADTLRLDLGPERNRTLQVAGEEFARAAGPLADSLAAALSVAETSGDPDAARAARSQVNAATDRIQAVFDTALRRAREALTEAQWARLPDAVKNPSLQMIPPNTLVLRGGDTW